jgi:apolipoprotein N-acyltransferase
MKNPLLEKFGRYFNIKILIKPFLAALLLSAPIYLIHFGVYSLWLNTLLVVSAFYLLLSLNAKEAFWAGFFTGLLWFYWIALSFRYYDLAWMIPIVMLFVALIYALLFFAGYFIASKLPFSPVFKALFWLGIGYVHPFGFNWFVPDMLLAHTYFNPDKLHFGLLLFALAALFLPRWFKLLSLALFLAFFPQPSSSPLAPLKIKLVTTHIPQNKKWRADTQRSIIEQNLAAIEKAIDEGYEVVVLPESAFPLFLNRRLELLQRLQELSAKIAIITGALYVNEEGYFNSTYLFENGKVQIFNKVVLVPFGEEIPLPKPIAKWVNETFFGGSSDYTPAKEPATYTLKGTTFTNAICYEATHPIIYQTPSRFIIAMSNNAWFTPSIEPTLQWMLIKYFATIYHKCVYHSTNIAKTAIIR